MPQIEVKDASLAYETNGESGPWITLVNGHTRSAKDFRLLTRSLVEAGFQVLSFDNRGAGGTQTRGPFTLRDMVSDVYALWDKFGIKSSFLVGISMGGMISQIIASERNLSGLVLISTAASTNSLSPVSFGSWGSTIDEVKARLSHYVTPDYLVKNKLLIDAMAKQILNSVENEGFEEKAQAQRKAVHDLENKDLLPKISCPTLVIHGSLDAIIPLARAEELAAAIPKAELKVYEGAGHLLLAEDSKRLGGDIVSFCTSHRQ